MGYCMDGVWVGIEMVWMGMVMFPSLYDTFQVCMVWSGDGTICMDTFSQPLLIDLASSPVASRAVFSLALI